MTNEADDIDLKWLEDTVKDKGYDISKLISYEMNPAVADGENYVSKIYRLTIQSISKNGQKDKLSLIMKRRVDMDIDDENIKEKVCEIFTVEFQVYENILSQLIQYLVPEEQLWANCIAYVPGKDIYFEDLKVSGYKVASRQAGLDFDHCLLVFQSLAKLHAASCLAVENGKIDTTPYQKYLMLGTATMEHRPKTSEFELMTDVILKDWGPEWNEMADRFNKFKTSLGDIVHELGVFDENRFNVLCHGDTWVNNFMFKYDNTGKPVSLKFVDFQIANYNSLAFDICYLLSSSVNPDTKEKYLDTFIEAYCNTFSTFLEERGSLHPRPTPELVKNEISRLASFCLQISLRIRPIIMAPPEDFVTIADMMQNPGLDPKRRRLYANPNYVNVMKTDLPYILSKMESNK